MKNFVLIGAGGYIAPRHLQAIKVTGNQLLAALDKNDSVGILDNYFPDADFFTEFERFDRHIEKLKRHGIQTDYVSVCTPNYLHDAHIRFGLRAGADVICEKPLVLNPWNIDALAEMEKETGKKVYSVLQLRLHPSIKTLRQHVISNKENKVYDIDLKYITARGKWYHYSWKGNKDQSGGIEANIGVHFFDMLLWIFGAFKSIQVSTHSSTEASGTLELERANIRWYYSIDAQDLPAEIVKQNKRTYKMMEVDGMKIDFDDTTEDLHSALYQEVLNGNGIDLTEARRSIELLFKLREAFN